MKVKLYSLLALLFMFAAVSCSDDDDDEVPTAPVYKDSYVSRIKVKDLAAAGNETTIKMLYDIHKRVVEVNWGTCIPGRTQWKIKYDNDRTNFIYNEDQAQVKRYITPDGGGRAENLYFEDGAETSRVTFTYAGDSIIGSAEQYKSMTDAYSAVTDYKWNGRNISRSITTYTKDGADSLTVSAIMVHEDFAPNNTNIDFNVLFDALFGMEPSYSDAPLLFGMCGTKPSQLLLEKEVTYTFAADASRSYTDGYKVTGYSLNNGRIDRVDVMSKDGKKHLQLSIIYKSESIK